MEVVGARPKPMTGYRRLLRSPSPLTLALDGVDASAGSGSDSDSDSDSEAANTVPSASWACDACTFLSPGQGTCCGICDTMRQQQGTDDLAAVPVAADGIDGAKVCSDATSTATSESPSEADINMQDDGSSKKAESESADSSSIERAENHDAPTDAPTDASTSSATLTKWRVSFSQPQPGQKHGDSGDSGDCGESSDCFEQGQQHTNTNAHPAEPVAVAVPVPARSFSAPMAKEKRTTTGTIRVANAYAAVRNLNCPSKLALDITARGMITVA